LLAVEKVCSKICQIETACALVAWLDEILKRREVVMKAVQFDVKIPQYLTLKVIGALSERAYYSGPLSTVKLVDIPEPSIPFPDWVKIKVYPVRERY